MDDLAGLRALVVEDEASVALLIEDWLAALGCEIAASVASLRRACECAASTPCDFAVLDVNLAGELVFPAARILVSRSVPFLFATGYGASGIDPEFGRHPIVTKPFTALALRAGIVAALALPAK